MSEFSVAIAAKLNIRVAQVEAVLDLFKEGATIPFIARYRKDKTNGLDEVQIQQIQDEEKLLKEFTERKIFIEKTIIEQDKMTPTLQEKINHALTLSELEDIYLPYKPKRKTKAQTAKENGLEPLSVLLLQQQNIDVETAAKDFLNEKIKTIEEALQGARDIIAEQINEDIDVRAKLRKLFEDTATLQSKLLTDKEDAAAKYKDYFDFSEPIYKVPSHRILAVLRGFLEGFLRISIAPEEAHSTALIESLYLKNSLNPTVAQVKKSIKDAYKRLLQPSLETEFRNLLKLKADEDAINVFAENLKQLLLGAPLGSKRILAIDPGYRTGCKVVCLDSKGELQTNTVIYIHEAQKKQEAEHVIKSLVDTYNTEAFAIGDGTAGRETEQFIKGLQLGKPIFLVNEDGASIYSASEMAREEFPNQDITVRGAVSIGRRLMDPLAELVKIDPKSIGVGQYQHDVNQFRLKEKLDQTVVHCVNKVGVNLNTTSKNLLSYVSGIGDTLAGNIVKYRNEIGKFSNRKQLLQVPRLGDKVYEQCAGFLRIKDGGNPLDASSIHPESYELVEKIATDLQVPINNLMNNESVLKKITPQKYISETIGTLTINDIIKELQKPGIDPRSEIEQFEFANVYALEELREGMVVPGIVTNITRFGAFIDIGVKQDGLVHVSEIANQYIADPSEALKLNDKIKVKILEVDIPRKRVALSIKQANNETASTFVANPKSNTTQRNGAPKPDADLSKLSVADALTVLKKKFGK